MFISDSEKLKRIEAIMDGDEFDPPANRLNSEEQDMQQKYIEKRKSACRSDSWDYQLIIWYKDGTVDEGNDLRFNTLDEAKKAFKKYERKAGPDVSAITLFYKSVEVQAKRFNAKESFKDSARQDGTSLRGWGEVGTGEGGKETDYAISSEWFSGGRDILYYKSLSDARSAFRGLVSEINKDAGGEEYDRIKELALHKGYDVIKAVDRSSPNKKLS